VRTKLTLIAACALATGLIAACGGDDDDGDDGATADSLTKAQYIEEADKICAEGNQEIEQAATEAFPDDTAPSAEDVESFASDTVEPTLRSELEQLQDLPAPDGDEQTLTALYGSLESALDKLADDPSLINDQAASTEAFAEANRLAKQYGMTECGEG
jgi:hypothetical protein